MTREYFIQPPKRAGRSIRYEAALNPQQLEAVTSPPGPALVLAGAGTGKTRTLTYRVVYLLDQGVPPQQILLLTFTNKAAREMMDRVHALLGRDLSSLWGGTFHAMGHRLLRVYASKVGLQPDFTIMDRDDSIHLWKECYKEHDKEIRAVQRLYFPKPEVLAEWVSFARNTCVPLKKVIEERFRDPDKLQQALPVLETLAETYQEKKRQAQLVDFDDLLHFWLELLENHPDVSEQMRTRFQHVLVDEYQDTNPIQARIVDLLVQDHHQVMAVGDDAQSIYSWRGANYRNILTFPERHPGTRIYRIEINYRSTPAILRLANAVIARNAYQFSKHLQAARTEGPQPALIVCPSAEDQARFVAQRVQELQNEGIGLDEMAVLYRSHFHALELQMILTQVGIPFTITSGYRFLEQAHIKDVAALLRWIINPYDEVAFKRIVQWFPGVGDKTATKLWQAQLQLLREHPDLQKQPPAHRANHLLPRFPSKAQPEWERLIQALGRIRSTDDSSESVSTLLDKLVQEFYADFAKTHYPNAEERLEDLAQLIRFAEEFESVEEFLAQLALLSSSESETAPGQGDQATAEQRLRLLTVHQAKGLEWRVVFVIMLCEGMFPSSRAAVTEEGLEEERRLFYVAVTRARDQLYLVYPLSRTFGSHYDYLTPSSFVEELPEDSYEIWKLTTEF